MTFLISLTNLQIVAITEREISASLKNLLDTKILVVNFHCLIHTVKLKCSRNRRIPGLLRLVAVVLIRSKLYCFKQDLIVNL